MEYNTYVSKTCPDRDHVQSMHFVSGYGTGTRLIARTVWTQTRHCRLPSSPAVSRQGRHGYYEEAEVREVLQGDGLVLYYQPILDLRTNRVVGVEALIRWLHPTKGLLVPALFLPAFEEQGLLKELDRTVLWMALHQAALWETSGQPLKVAVNVTAPSLQDEGFVEDVVMLLKCTSISATSIIIEVTEQSPMSDMVMTRHVLMELRKLGFHIALDDFGSGYSQIMHLQQFPADILKVDCSVVAGIGNNVKAETILRALLALGRELDLVVTAEGVEQPSQLAWLQAADCPRAQGMLLGKPTPPELLMTAVGAGR